MKNKNLKKVICGVLCGVLATSGVVSGIAFANSLDEKNENEKFDPVFRMAVCSDIHVATGYNHVQEQKFQKFFDSAYAYADGEEYATLDAVVATGDLTHNSEVRQMKTFRDIVKKNLRRETEFLSVLGNHDGEATGNDINAVEYKDWVHTETDRHLTVKGFHLIALSNADANANFEQAQFDWMEEQLVKAESEDAEKPIFVFQHQHVKDTVQGSGTAFNVVKVRGETYETATAFNDLYSQYSQIIHFSGHSHTPSVSPMSIYQDGYTTIDVGSSFSSMSFTLTGSYLKSKLGISAFDNATNALPNAVDAANQFRVVEVDENNKVRVLTYDMKTEGFVKTPSTTDADDELLVFEIDVKNPTTYTNERAEKASAPYFESGATVAVTPSATGATIAFAQAQDNECMCAYKVVCTPTDGEVLNFAFLDDFYYPTLAGSAENFTLTGLTANTEYTVSVVPCNVWGIAGEAITSSFTTLAE